jgi:hypothetical protein
MLVLTFCDVKLLALGGQHRVKVSENRLLRKFHTKTEETGEN